MYNERIRSVIEHSSLQAQEELQQRFIRFKELTKEFDPGEVDIRKSMEKLKDSKVLAKNPSLLSLASRKSKITQFETSNVFCQFIHIENAHFEDVDYFVNKSFDSRNLKPAEALYTTKIQPFVSRGEAASFSVKDKTYCTYLFLKLFLSH